MEIEVVEFILEFVLAQILFICEFLNLVGEMCFHFARIMNLSINIPIFKKALVIPVFKKNYECDISNYRTVAIQSAFPKLF